MDTDSGRLRDNGVDSIEVPEAIILEVAEKFRPMSTNVSATWRSDLQGVRQRFLDSLDREQQLKCVLVHSIAPEWPARPDGPFPKEVEGMTPVAMGAGPSRWPQQYFRRTDKQTESIVSEFNPTSAQSYRLRTLGLSSKLQFGETEFAPVAGDRVTQNESGNPILFANGEPVSIRPGISRNYFLYSDGQPNEQITSVTSFFSIASDAGQCLHGLPNFLNQVLWQQWTDGFRVIGDKGMWINALFELAWQNVPDVSLNANKSAWTGTTTIPFDHSIDESDQPAHWFSVISDLVPASIVALDFLLSIEENRDAPNSNPECN